MMPTPDQIKKLRLTQEQVGRYDRSVDVWAVGVLAFECLTGAIRTLKGFGAWLRLRTRMTWSRILSDTSHSVSCRMSCAARGSAGQPPFEVEDAVQTAQRILHSPPVTGFPRGVSPECISFMHQVRSA